ncbi:protein TonB [Geothermobacter ehrlichii]|uniref:Protein TonB n=1 Tax=Geothermobacter ehrlichii TaxID=213224 RepID=A0A5D3WJ09_9BACT|nr:TonB family protein [Geothermobacter ehrlichii]TYO96348.1 protein TonB [Geothermobacter ehrlichii]
MNRNRSQQNLLWGALLLSLLLHLVFLYLTRNLDPFAPKVRVPERIVVRMLPRELDLPVRPELDRPRKKPAKRLAARNQVVERETAPRGDSPEDRRPDAPAPPAARPRPKMVAPQPRKGKPAAQSPTVSSTVKVPKAPAPVVPAEKEQRTKTGDQARPLPDVESLLQLPDATVARLDSEWRRKERSDVAVGDEVWLDTEQDLLFSFFQRLRDNIYNVWNYPSSAVRQGREGRCLLRMTFDRQGEVVKVELLRSSGTRALDRAALAAVRKGAPYGPLPSVYPGKRLTVKAWFRYDLKRSRVRGADIYGQ